MSPQIEALDGEEVVSSAEADEGEHQQSTVVDICTSGDIRVARHIYCCFASVRLLPSRQDNRASRGA